MCVYAQQAHTYTADIYELEKETRKTPKQKRWACVCGRIAHLLITAYSHHPTSMNKKDNKKKLGLIRKKRERQRAKGRMVRWKARMREEGREGEAGIQASRESTFSMCMYMMMYLKRMAMLRRRV
jgi:hypothetical protein